METVRWLGTAAAAAEVDNFTPANVEINDIFTLTATGEDGTTAAINFTATAATVANVTAGLTAAWNASTNALCTPITAADMTTYMKLTADTAGVPFYVASTTTDGGGANTQTLTRAVGTAQSGPNDFNTAANWSGGILPADTDNLYFENSAIDLLYGLLAASRTDTSIALTSLNSDKSYTGKLGQGSIPFQIGATAVNIGYHYGYGSPAGSARLNLDLGTIVTTINVFGSAAAAYESALDPIRLMMSNVNSVLNVMGGKVGVATNFAGELASLATINVSNIVAATVNVGVGCTVVTYKQIGGTNVFRGIGTTIITVEGGTLTTDSTDAIVTFNVNDGTVYIVNIGAITTLNLGGGTAYYDSTSTVTTANVTGILDFRRTLNARIFTTTKLYKGGKIYDNAITTFTNGIALQQCDISDVTLEIGTGKTLSIS